MSSSDHPREDAEQLIFRIPCASLSPPSRGSTRQTVSRAFQPTTRTRPRLHESLLVDLYRNSLLAGLPVRSRKLLGSSTTTRSPRAFRFPVELAAGRRACAPWLRAPARKPRRSTGPDRSPAERRQVPALHRRIHRLLARPSQDRRQRAVHHALQRLRAGRPAEARRRGGNAAVLRRVCGNLPARNVVDSDFTFLNERLAKHYGIAGVTGVAMRKVELPTDACAAGS